MKKYVKASSDINIELYQELLMSVREVLGNYIDIKELTYDANKRDYLFDAVENLTNDIQILLD